MIFMAPQRRPETLHDVQVSKLRCQASAAVQLARQERDEARQQAAAASAAAGQAQARAEQACVVRLCSNLLRHALFRKQEDKVELPEGHKLCPMQMAGSHRQVLHTQLAEEQQLRQAAEQGCTAAQAEEVAARQAAAEYQGVAMAAASEAEQRAAAAAKATRRADTAAAVAAAQRQQAEQASDLFQRRLHEVQMQLRMQQQQACALREQMAKARTCMLTVSM